MELQITSFCKIQNNSVWVNDTKLFQGEACDLGTFLNNCYRVFNLAYPKFFKMDKLCKLGVLASDLAIKNSATFEQHNKENIALIFSNRASSLDSDRSHAQSITDKNQYFPSPSVFVYTLPNIVIGEIAIKHKITGENAFFVCESIDIDLLLNYTQVIFSTTSTTCALCAWINVDGNDYEAFVFCLEKATFNQENHSYKIPFTKASIKNRTS